MAPCLAIRKVTLGPDLTISSAALRKVYICYLTTVKIQIPLNTFLLRLVSAILISSSCNTCCNENVARHVQYFFVQLALQQNRETFSTLGQLIAKCNSASNHVSINKTCCYTNRSCGTPTKLSPFTAKS